ncbi:hypothetical protein [Salipiger sp.]|uniref:hypothetical protein n=1 Tax=Salipiger sp. TaxID=2078585 RepID=UPI003A96EFF1
MIPFLLRIATRARPRKALRTFIGAAVTHWRSDYEKGRLAAERGGDPLLAAFYTAVRDYAPTETDPARLSGPHGSKIIALWAAYRLPPDLFHRFNALAGRGGQSILFSAMLMAEDEAAVLRPSLPRQVPKRPRPRPRLQSVETLAAREAWAATGLFPISGHDRQSALAAIEPLSADDLHVIACGLGGMDCAGLIEAMADHPRLDRGTALELLFSYGASGYQSGFRDGSADTADADELTLFRAFDRLAERANAGDFRTARLANRLHDDIRRIDNWSENPETDPAHPRNWVRWTLTPRALKPTAGERPRSDLECSQGPVRYRFEVWQKKSA